MRIVAVMGGGDWYDASVNHLEIPEDMILDEMHTKYRAWYNLKYRTSRTSRMDAKRLKFKTFTDFLIENGAIVTERVEEYWED